MTMELESAIGRLQQQEGQTEETQSLEPEQGEDGDRL